MNTAFIQAEAFCRIRSRGISTLNHVDSIYVDTCTLMNETFADFVKIFGREFRKQGMKLIILTQVYDELKNLTLTNSTEKKQAAQQSTYWGSSPDCSGANKQPSNLGCRYA